MFKYINKLMKLTKLMRTKILIIASFDKVVDLNCQFKRIKLDGYTNRFYQVNHSPISYMRKKSVVNHKSRVEA